MKTNLNTFWTLSPLPVLIGLELGADDYICKPFSPREVVARIKVILRRTNSSLADEPQYQNLTLDPSCYTASLKGKDLDLTPVEFRILEALCGPPIRIYNRQQLIDKMYDDHRAVSDRTVDSHIANLRKKLKNIDPGPDFIQPVYGVGYRYVP